MLDIIQWGLTDWVWVWVLLIDFAGIALALLISVLWCMREKGVTWRSLLKRLR